MRKPNPTDIARRGYARDQNMQRYGSPYPPGEWKRSLLAVLIMGLIFGGVALYTLVLSK